MTESFHSSLLIQLPYGANHRVSVTEFLADDKKDIPSHAITFLNPDQEPIKIETVRTLIKDLSYASYDQNTHYYIALAFDSASIAAQNALLKSLEEPPQNVQIILTTEQPDKIVPTIHSRCQLIVINSQSSETRQEVLDIISQFGYCSLADCSRLAETYKNRDQALDLVLDIQEHWVKTNLASKTSQSQILLKTYRYLQANTNVVLTLEHCFFTLNQLAKQS